MDDKNNILAENDKTGYLLNEKNIKLHRMYFKQMCDALGMTVLYRTPIRGAKQYNMYGELDAHFNLPEKVRIICDEHPTQQSMKKMGWNAELAETSILIHVPYDLHDLEAGCLFIIPSGLDHAEGRVFKVLRMQNIAIYPASIACELGPVLVDNSEPAVVNDFKHTNTNLLDDESEDYGH